MISCLQTITVYPWIISVACGTTPPSVWDSRHVVMIVGSCPATGLLMGGCLETGLSSCQGVQKWCWQSMSHGSAWQCVSDLSQLGGSSLASRLLIVGCLGTRLLPACLSSNHCAASGLGHSGVSELSQLIVGCIETRLLPASVSSNYCAISVLGYFAPSRWLRTMPTSCGLFRNQTAAR